jgi:hypothetical protein
MTDSARLASALDNQPKLFGDTGFTKPPNALFLQLRELNGLKSEPNRIKTNQTR